MEKKRPLKSNAPHFKPKKRQKLNKSTADRPIKTPKKNASAVREKVRLDQLRWKEVEMPDRMDDYEGFFGLEEIDDVEVVRNDSTGEVSFHAAKSAVSGDAAEQLEKEQEEDDEEWSGFSAEEDNEESGVALEDELENEAPEAVSEPASEPEQEAAVESPKESVPEPESKSKKQKAKKDREEKKRKVAPAEAQQEPLGALGSGFAGLEDEVDEEEADVSAWMPLNLAPESLLALSKLKFSKPTPIQSAAIPEVLAGNDVIGKASTGSGKTLTFGLPIIERYLSQNKDGDLVKKDKKNHVPTALILAPTRELAHQITNHLKSFTSAANLERPSIISITGGLSIQKQQRQLEDADIIVGTPGRLWEVISNGHGLIERLKKISFLVVDEADRLLSEGHFKEAEEIMNILEREDEHGRPIESEADLRQTLVFSATFHKGLQQKLTGKAKFGGDLMDKKESMEYLLKKLNFKDAKPKFIDVNPVTQMAEGLKEGLVECVGLEKDLYLYALLLYHPKKRTLVFTNSISAVRRITPYLQNLNIPALALHSNMPQKARLRSIERFTAQEGSVLIATDVAARGLDIPGVQLVIHYHLPRTADMYVHRSGRTARADTSGSSIIICGPEEVTGVRRLVAKVHAKADNRKNGNYFIRTLDIDRRVVSRLKPRTTLAKQLADANIAKEKQRNNDDLLREAAEDLGVEYDSEELESNARGRTGRGNKRKQKEREARTLRKAEVGAMRAELKSLLSQRVNVGVSERYLTSSGLDINALLSGEKGSEFLGHIDGLGLEDD